MRPRLVLVSWVCATLFVVSALDAPVVTTASLPPGTVGSLYTATLAATGGRTPYTFTATGLPSTLSVNGNQITGTPTATFSGNVTVTATDSSTPHASSPPKTLSLTISASPVTVTTSSPLPNGTVGGPYTAPLAATGGTGPYTFTATGLPSTLSVNGNQITGTPTATFSGNITVTATDSSTPHASSPPKTLSLTISASPVTVTTGSPLPNGTVGSAYTAPLAATGGTGPYTFSATGLPSTLSVNGNQITGTPTATFSGNITVTATDSAMPAVSSPPKTLSLTISASPVTVTTGSPLPNGTVGSPYTAPLAATGGTGPYTFTATGLPSTLSVNGNQITGTPAATFSGNVTVTATDSSTPHASSLPKTLSLTISAPPVTVTTGSPLPNGTVGSPYTAPLAATGGTGPYTFSATGLPSTLSVNGNQITGTPAATFSGNITVTATDSAMPAVSSPPKTLSLTITPATLAITTSSLPRGTVGSSYSAMLSASGGIAPYNWSIISGAPAGLGINGSSITGTPTAAGTFSVVVKVTDSANPAASSTATLSITINNPPVTVTTASLPNGTVGASYSQSLSATGGTGSYTWALTSGTLPNGLALSGNQISGTPTVKGSASFTVKATDTANASGTQTLSITIDPAPVSVTTSSLSNATVGVVYSASLAASGGTGAYNWSIANGSLPAGLMLTGNQIAGTPTTSGTANFTVKATDAANPSASASQPLSIVVNNAPVRITTTTLPDGTVGVNYSQSLSATGGTGSYTWTTTSGSLPAGLTLSGNQITGTPTTAGGASFSLRATDSANVSAAEALSININPPPMSVTTKSLPDGTVGKAYSQQLSATGGTGSFTWSVSSGNLPPGLSLSGNTISGTPTTAGAVDFTVKATDTLNGSATQALSITIHNPPINITTTTLSNGTVGVAYSQSLAATGGTGSYSWTVAGGALPAGLALSGNQISGTPSAAGTADFTVKAADTDNASATQALHISVFAGLTIAACPVATGTVGQLYASTLSGAGGSPPYQWSAVPLPTGLSINASSGQIGGTPTQSGVTSSTIKLSDANGASTTQSCSLSIASPLTVAGAGLSDGTQGAAYSQGLSASGGQPPYTWSLAGGSLPPGISLDTSGQLSGIAGTAGSFSFTARVSDKTGVSATADFSIKVTAGLALASCPVPRAMINQPYASSIGASGGRPPYNWSISGQLPAGLSFDSRSGAISGTPTQSGPVSFSVSVADSASPPVTIACSITVSQPIAIDSGAMPATTLSVPYSQQLSASGGTPPYTWSLSAGSLPPGLSLTGSGQITGTTSSTGTYTFMVRVGDSANASTTRSYTIQVAAALSIGSCPATTLVAGRNYRGLFTASGGLPPYAWSVASGLLPAGIQLSASTGAITGSTADVGNYNYTVQAVDKAGATGSISCSLTVTPGLTITVISIADATERSLYAQVLQATGGTPPYSWSLSSGSLPPGLTLNSNTGVIAGTPTQTGTFSFTATVSDTTRVSVTRTYTITVAAGLIVPACPAGPAEAGFAYASSLTAVGGAQPYIFTISAALPPGLNLDSGANAITGTPTQAGSFPFSVAVVDKTNAAAKRECTLEVRAAVRIVTDSLASGSTGTPYVSTLAAAAGAPPYTWSTSAGALPPGLFLNAGTGQITGTPTFSGNYSFTAQIADSVGAQVSKDFTIIITQGLSIADCPRPAAMLGQPYSATLVVGGGTAPYAWSISQGGLPSGLTLQSNAGVISGTPGQAGLYPYTVRVDDASSRSATRACSIQISSGNLSITTSATLPPALAGITYSQTLGASGGDAPYTWTVVDGALPDGITLDAGGTIAGTTSSLGSYQFMAQVADQDGSTMRQAFTLVVQAGTPPEVQITGLPDIIAPAQQPVFDVQLSSAYPSPITGTITLAFTPDPDVKVSDPAIQFATGGRTLNFSVPANSTKVTFAAPIAALQTGTVAGTIQLTAKLQSNGADITSNPAPQRSTKVDRLAPKITSMTAVKTTAGFEVRIIGYSTTRDVTQGTFHVVFSNGTSADSMVTLADSARAWFSDAASTPFGGQFSLTQPFSLQGQGALTSVSVTLANGQGASAAVSANF